MLMTAFFVVFVGGFVAIAALGHVLVFKAIVFGKSDPRPDPRSLASRVDHAGLAS